MIESKPPAPPRGRPKTTYYHSGIGGRGNYHKRNKDTSPPKHHANFSRSLLTLLGGYNGSSRSQESSSTKEDEAAGARLQRPHIPCRWLIKFGGLKSKWLRRHHSPPSDMSCTTVTSAYSSHAPPFEATDVVRKRKSDERSTTKMNDD